jgi:hypothetical protein
MFNDTNVPFIIIKKNQNQDQRKATIVYYLNPGWDVQGNGGQLRLYTRSGQQVRVYVCVCLHSVGFGGGRSVLCKSESGGGFSCLHPPSTDQPIGPNSSCHHHHIHTYIHRQVDVAPEGDTLVLFLSDELEHEVGETERKRGIDIHIHVWMRVGAD